MNLTSEIIKRLGVAIVLGSLWFSYNIVLQVLASIAIAILVFSCAVLRFRERLSQSRWKKLAEISELDITFAGLALTMILAGSRLVIGGLEAHVSAGIIAGWLIILAGGFFLGGAFGQGITKIILELYHRKPRKNYCDLIAVSHSGENMTSDMNQGARNVADEFARWATEQYHDFKEFLNLYDSSEKRRELLEETAKGFFSDLFWMYINRIIQNVSNLTDPPETGGNLNFSIRSVHNYFQSCLSYRTKAPETLIENIEAKAKKVRAWRNKLGGHYDWHVAIGDKNVSDKFVRGDFEVLYDNLRSYVELLFSSVFNKPFDINAVSYYGTIDLVKALKEAHALRVLKKRDINTYHDLMSTSTFKDA